MMAWQTKRLTCLAIILHTATRGRLPRGSATDPVGLLQRTTVWRKSGQQRTISLGDIRRGPAYVVTATNGGSEHYPAWYHNLCANPQVTIRVHGQELGAVAEVAAPEQRSALWTRFVELAPMYAGYTKSAKREIPLVLLHPSDAPNA
jgi:F420H(2)-dependent quinone reductase